MIKVFKKVMAGDYNVRYIDSEGKWFKELFNGKLLPSKPMPIHKEYCNTELTIDDEGVFGLRVVSKRDLK